ncbi:17503_t:CDS:2 [Dentiscutata erythropus]|uniref:17503_t:CDS:1 n=1 Tax=Dentiscutata erythropus TaxID=1348616 RepID=A0A9N9H6A8_9GLOM|nr:17503_t:CDS:2 [Dentiscutata erythropus]
MFAEKFIVENLEQYVIASSVSVVTISGPNQEFEADEIPLSAHINAFNIIHLLVLNMFL